MTDAMKYGNAKVTTIHRDFEKLRQAIRTWDNAAIQEAWDKCERWLGFVHEAQALSARVAELEAQQSPAQGVRVKPLEWSVWGNQGGSVIYKGTGADCVYKLTLHKDGSGNLYRLGFETKRVVPYATTSAGIEWFKAAAQADYERRILSAIEPAPITAQQAAGVLLENDDAISEIAITQMRANKPVAGKRIGYLPALKRALTAIATQEGETGNE